MKLLKISAGCVLLNVAAFTAIVYVLTMGKMLASTGAADHPIRFALFNVIAVGSILILGLLGWKSIRETFSRPGPGPMRDAVDRMAGPAAEWPTEDMEKAEREMGIRPLPAHVPHRLTWEQIEKILMVSHPKGCALSRMMEKRPPAAAIILEGAFVGLLTSQIESILFESAPGWKVDAATEGFYKEMLTAIAEARSLYA